MGQKPKLTAARDSALAEVKVRSCIVYISLMTYTSVQTTTSFIGYHIHISPSVTNTALSSIFRVTAG